MLPPSSLSHPHSPLCFLEGKKTKRNLDLKLGWNCAEGRVPQFFVGTATAQEMLFASSAVCLRTLSQNFHFLSVLPGNSLRCWSCVVVGSCWISLKSSEGLPEPGEAAGLICGSEESCRMPVATRFFASLKALNSYCVSCPLLREGVLIIH